MLLHVPEVLEPDEVRRLRALLAEAEWVDGRITAGTQSAQAKNNRQVPDGSPAAVAGGEIVLAGLQRSALFFTAALPKKIVPPLFNRYDGAANAFGNHVDNAVRTVRSTATHSVKLPAGDLILYPASSVHRVEPVTRGARIASFFWIQSMVRDPERRRLLFDLDMAIMALRQRGSGASDDPAVVQLTNCYHNLTRMWADV